MCAGLGQWFPFLSCPSSWLVLEELRCFPLEGLLRVWVPLSAACLQRCLALGFYTSPVGSLGVRVGGGCGVGLYCSLRLWNISSAFYYAQWEEVMPWIVYGEKLGSFLWTSTRKTLKEVYISHSCALWRVADSECVPHGCNSSPVAVMLPSVGVPVWGHCWFTSLVLVHLFTKIKTTRNGLCADCLNVCGTCFQEKPLLNLPSNSLAVCFFRGLVRGKKKKQQLQGSESIVKYHNTFCLMKFAH